MRPRSGARYRLHARFCRRLPTRPRAPGAGPLLDTRRDIARGVFEPLERLTVEHLVKFYRVGHSPIREAIVLLSSSGLVIHEHQKGYRVAPVSLADYDEVLGVYQRLYKLALEMAIELGDDAWEERVLVQRHRAEKVRMVALDADPQEREKRFAASAAALGGGAI